MSNATVPSQRAGQLLSSVDYDPFAQAALARVMPVTEPQREVWLADKLGMEGSLAYNESVSLRLHGVLDEEALRSAVRELAQRHESLRATLSPNGDELCIAEDFALDVSRRDLSAVGPEAAEEVVRARLREVVETPFDLERGPLIRVELLVLAEREHVLVLTAHHIVCDGWSFGVLVHDLAALYARHAGHQAADLDPPASFSHYAQAQAALAQTTEYQDNENYWVSRFAGSIPSLDLPLDRPRPRQRTFAAGREDVMLDAGLLAEVRRLGARNGASLFATLFTGFTTLMRRLSGQSDVVVGIAVAGQALGGHDAVVGHCVNILPVRSDVQADAGFATALAATAATLLDAFEHQQYTYGTLLQKLAIRRDPSRLPLVNVLFNLDQPLDQDKCRFPGLEFEFAANARSYEAFELFVNAVPVDGGLRLECQYNRDLYDAASVRHWMEAYATLLRAAVEQPDRAMGELSLVDAAAQAELAALQPAPTPYDPEVRVHESFEAQADRTPLRIAVRSGGVALTYADLESRSNRIAHLLRARGVQRGALVGIALDRGADMLAALLGVLKAGAGYVPLDPSFPGERLAYMAGDAGLAVLLTQHQHAERFDVGDRPVLLLDRLDSALAELPATRIGRDDGAAAPESTAYVIYTSGSTGRPKGVQVPHRAVANFLAGMQREPGITMDDRLVAVTTLSFDIAVLELLLPLSVGAEVVLADRDTSTDGGKLMALLGASAATMMQATPATWQLLLEAGWKGGAAFHILCGGEPLSPDLARQLLPRGASLWNLYGPTETTVWSTCARIEAPGPGLVPDISIGRPIANTQVWILDAHGQCCPRGVPGEICIGGDGVTHGYLGRPELTAERFVADRFCGVVDAGSDRAVPRLYRTGDRGRWRSDGTLEHLGRLDFQVKVRGYRIELGEIEANLSNHPGVARCVVIAREDRPGDVRLVAYVVHQPGMSTDGAALHDHLRGVLPDYMLPQHFVALAAIPLLPNGKIDRGALPAPDLERQRAAGHVAPRNELERAVAAIMEDVLALPGIGVDDDFFALGGHSLLAAQLTSRLNRELGVALSLRTLFDAPTVARLSEVVASEATRAAPSPDPIVRRPDQSRAPLSLMQERLRLLEDFNPGQLSYNTPSAHRLSGALDVVLLDRALRDLAQRQTVLRTTIAIEDGEPVQVIHDDIETGLLQVHDMTGVPADEREADLARRLQALVEVPFDDLAKAPLFCARLFRMGPDEHVLFFMPHHIIWDGWSFDLLYAELAELYAAHLAQRPPDLVELPVSYGDYAAWHREWVQGPEYARQLAFWREQLGGQDDGPASSTQAMPTDKPRRSGMSGHGKSQALAVPGELTLQLRKAGLGMDATLFVTLLTAYYALMSRMTGHRRLIVGTPVRGRNVAQVENLMGYFTNLLPLHVEIDPLQSFADAVRRVKAMMLDSFASPDIRLEDLVRELNLRGAGGGGTLYQSLFSFQDIRQRIVQWGNLRHRRVEVFQPAATEDLGMWFIEDDAGLSGGMIYNADIFHDTTISLLRERYLALLQAVVADPTQSIETLTRFDDGQPVLIGGDRTQDATAAAVAAVAGPAAQDPSGSATNTQEGTEVVDPRARYLVDLWSELLGVPVRAGDNFFDLGGNSMLGVQMAERVARDTGMRIKLMRLATQTLEQIAEDVPVPTTRAAAPAIGRTDRAAPLPLGLVQQRMWLHQQVEPETVLYNLPAAWRLTGPLQRDAFLRAFGALVARHDVLRVSIQQEEGEPTQHFGAPGGADLAVEDLAPLAAGERERTLAQRLVALRDEAIDLEHGPPYHARLFRLADEEHVLFLMPHHVVWDGWSFDIFLRDFNELYSAAVSGRPASLPELAIQYVDYAVWHRNWLREGALQREMAYWGEVLSGELTPLDLPIDLPRPKRFSYRGDWEEFTIAAGTLERITQLAAFHRSTSFMVLLAAWGAFIHRLSGQHDFVVGVPIQARQHPEVTDLIGCFVNTLCLRLRIDPDATFGQLIHDVRNTSLAAYEHQDAPVDLLVDQFVSQRDASRTPLFQTMFTHERVSQRPARLGELAVAQVYVNPAATPTDLMLAVMEGAGSARGAIRYSTDLFTAATVHQLRLRFEHFLETALADPATCLHALPLLAPEERDTVVSLWNDTGREVARHATASELLSPVAWRSMGNPALRCGTQSISYAELDSRANRLARRLRDLGIARGALVGLCVERSVQMVVAQLAILRAGAAYVPLDPAYPPDRLAFVASDARLALLVTDAATASVLQWPRDRSVWLDVDSVAIEALPDAALAPDAALDARREDPAYVIYTSGSTGKPKGVAVPHRALVNFLGSMAGEPGLRASDRLLAVTTLSFDISVLELLLPLSVGAEVVLASRDEAMDGEALRALLESSGATVMQATPVTWRVLIDSGWTGGSDFKALVGGEALPPELARQLLARAGEVWNMYGPTETTVWSTCWRVQHPEQGISIGRPIANTQVHVLDERMQLCPIGVPGELYIGGEGVSLGYLHRPELTAERFVPDPFASEEGARLYRTGDRGRWLGNGTLEHLGRLDLQVKLRGYRIELGEIEARLAELPAVDSTVVVMREDQANDVRLVAYIVGAAGHVFDEAALRAALKDQLPDYMLPQRIVEIAALPLLPNGKIDRNALPAPPLPRGPRHTVAALASLDPRVAYLVRVWSDLLETDASPRANFFDLGGHSMLAVQMANRVARDTGVRIKLMRLATQTLEQIAMDLPMPTTRAGESERLGARIARGFKRLFAND